MFARCVDRPHCVSHMAGCEDIEAIAQLIKPKDDLVTVDIKKEFNHIFTVHRSHLITLITKAINTTTISYQP